ncbi:MAG: hypothetical protein CM15mP102_14780 [Flavobacteriales bacterium]|nr:MAG: hypothetical protein CM15mP102_14780 [Flavobacteriales bacterium]
MVDTNTDPNKVDFGIPSNDDASKSIEIILKKVTESIKEGLHKEIKKRRKMKRKKEKVMSLKTKLKKKKDK